MASQKKEIYLILHNIRSTYNVGAVFRTADAAGVKEIFLTGYTPTPVDRFGVLRKEISKTSLGAEKTVNWQYCKSISSLIKKLKKDGFSVVAVEQDKKAKDYRELKLKKRTAFVFGNEVRGLSGSVIENCDYCIELPMSGDKESLNVSVTAGIVMYHFSF